MDLPTIRQIECFAAVAETLHFRRAAEGLHLSQPALSAQVRQLETLLGVRLFERDRRRVLLTEAGESLAHRARAILSSLADFADAAGSLRAPLEGTLTLGVIPTIAPYALPRGMAAIARRFPALRLRLLEAPTHELVAGVEGGTLDLAFLALEADLHELRTLAVREDPFVLAVPSSHRLAERKRVRESELEGEEVLLLDEGHCLRTQALGVCARNGAGESGDFRATSLTTLVQMVANGQGVTLLPEIAVPIEAPSERSLSLLRFTPRGPGRTLGLAWRASSQREKEFALLADALREGLAERG